MARKKTVVELTLMRARAEARVLRAARHASVWWRLHDAASDLREIDEQIKIVEREARRAARRLAK